MARLLDTIHGWLDRQPAIVLSLLGLIGVAAIGLADYLTDPDLASSIFYVAPIAMVAWYGDRQPGLLISLVSAGTWLWADRTTGHAYSSPAILFWNAGVRFCFFLLITWLLTRLRFALDSEKELARLDAHTSLLNSRAFRDEAQHFLNLARRQGQPFSLVYLDLDNFKQLNDRHGHGEGDRILRAVAATLRESVRQSDLVGRLGGDEFALYLPATDAEGAAQFVAKIAGRLNEALAVTGGLVTASIGAVAFHTPPESLDDAIRLADQAMYRVKSDGKNSTRVVAWPVSG